MARVALFACAGGVLALGAMALAAIKNPVGDVPREGFEALRSRAAYLTSQSCLPCHRDHTQSWARTFHRTMTQAPSTKSIQAPFDGRTVDALDVRSRVSMDGATYFVNTLDPQSGAMAPHAVARLTGSRRMQQFESFEQDRFVRLPLAWSIAEQRWFHLSEAFFHPDGEGFDSNRATWDLNCIFCHTTKAAPGLDTQGRLSSKSAELGIACEACHGPGEEHARRMRSPLRRYAFQVDHPIDPTIVNPKRLDPVRSVQVCAHCHGQRLPKEEGRIREIMSTGDAFTPGEDLSRLFVPVTRESTVGTFSFAARFWPDGSPRLTAYEYQGLLRSKCFTKGGMTCLSCHAMHAGDPRGQLRPDRPGDQLCTQCHTQLQGAELARHTHHRAEGEGSRCISCHMPNVVYGVMTWHPTHEIAAPDPRAAGRHQMPDACTVCHSGRSRSWAVSAADAFWPARRREEPTAASEVPELVHALSAGDAVYRTLAAFRLGEPSPDPELKDRAVPLLAELLVDAYPNVRRTARNSLARLTGRTDLPFAHDPLAAREAARSSLQTGTIASLKNWPFSDGHLDHAVLAEWAHERKENPVSIGE